MQKRPTKEPYKRVQNEGMYDMGMWCLQRETCKIDLQREAYKQIKYRCMHGASMSSLGTTELWLFCRSRMPLFSPKGIRIGLFCGSRIRLFCLLFQKICESLGATVGTTALWLFCRSRIRLFFAKCIRIAGRHDGLSCMSLSFVGLRWHMYTSPLQVSFDRYTHLFCRSFILGIHGATMGFRGCLFSYVLHWVLLKVSCRSLLSFFFFFARYADRWAPQCCSVVGPLWHMYTSLL